jgi:hypothetical protein
MPVQHRADSFTVSACVLSKYVFCMHVQRQADAFMVSARVLSLYVIVLYACAMSS